ncbi:tyrosine-protein phosphatase [Gordonia crocea]|uniref:Phosphatase n=1 Tax=Gordonia crocea TaxID=589162 RepID=A0A7I9V1W7_9ACTN|nr:tyrosine-protein phosphatase [Gordonia crocea]GED99395.1 phosphatase [Gordonia crocea]
MTADRTGLADIGLKTIVDLRTDTEREGAPDPQFPGVTELALDVLADTTSIALPANIAELLADPAVVAQMSAELTVDKAHSLMASTYRDFVTLDSAKRGFGDFYTGLLDGGRTPALFHCTNGKDRTGWAAATFLSLMGVRTEDVYRDYLLTNDRLLPAMQPMVDRFTAAGGDRRLLLPLLGVDTAYLDAAFDQVRVEYGTLERYFGEALGVDAEAQRELRSRFLVTPV